MRHHLSALSRRQARQRAEMARLRAETLAERERVRRERLELEQQAREMAEMQSRCSRDTVEMQSRCNRDAIEMGGRRGSSSCNSLLLDRRRIAISDRVGQCSGGARIVCCLPGIAGLLRAVER